jgi:hypothetical protein
VAVVSGNADSTLEKPISRLKNGFCTRKCKFPVGNDDLSPGNGDIYLEMMIFQVEMAIFT